MSDRPAGTDGWARFVAGYHARNPAVTEDLLAPMRGPGGLQPYAWLCEDLPAAGGVWDLCCGSAPVADVVGLDRYEGVDLSTAELEQARLRRPGVRVREADALAAAPGVPPVAVTVAMALMLLPLRETLARVADLLPPGGRLHALVPTRENAAGTSYGTLLRLLGQHGPGYRQVLEPTAVRAAADGAGLELLDDEVAVFERPVPPHDVDLVVRSFYLRHTAGAGPAEAARWLAARVDEPGWRLQYPLRRLRAVRR